MPLMLQKRHSAHFAPLILCFASLCASAAESDVRVLRFEPIDLEFSSTQSTANLKSAAAVTTMRFEAFGKNYLATLEPNRSVQVPANSGATVYRGSIDSRSDSWVRITRVGDVVHGLLFDGTELFGIEPAVEVGGVAEQGTAIFKLSDTTTELGAEFCALLKPSEEASGLALFKSLSGESKSLLQQMQKSGARSRLQLSALMDLAFRNRYSSDSAANDAIVARVNNMDGIFSSQLGVEIELASTTQAETQSKREFLSSNSDTMLQTVARLRSESPSLYSTGVTHLFTGTDMDGKTIGIAYMDAVCGQRYAATLSEARDRGAWYDALVAAHELGHSFGSPHDGEGECASMPSTFLMSAIINGNDRFSQCSLNKIQTRAQSASCLVPIPLPDISLPAILSEYHASIATNFTWSIAVANVGNADSTDSQVTIALPASMTVNAVMVTGASCSIGGGTVTCNLGTLAKQEVRNIDLQLIGTQSGSYSLTATVKANADLDSANNFVTAGIRIDPTVDMALTLAAPSSLTVDESFTATMTLTNKSNLTQANVSVDVEIPAGLSLSQTATLNGVGCQSLNQVVHCVAAVLTPGSSVTGSLALVARAAGSQVISAKVDGAFNDPNPGDNVIQKAIAVSGATLTAAANASSTPEPSGGGGSISTLSILLLSAFALTRRRARNACVERSQR